MKINCFFKITDKFFSFFFLNLQIICKFVAELQKQSIVARPLEYAFRLVHIKNIPHILDVGFVLPTSPKASDGYVQIGDGVVIAKRHTLPNSGDVDLRQFIPFYLGPRSPMLYVIQKGYNRVTCFHPSELVYCIVRLSDILEQDIECMFTDGHAFSAITRYYTREYLGKIDDYVKREDVYAQFWNVEDDIDLKRRKEAELLIKTELPAKYIKGFVVYNNEARVQLLEYGVAASKIVIRESYYF